MFDSVLRPAQLPRHRFGSGTFIAVLVHAGIGVVAIELSVRAASAKTQEPEVTFVAQRPAAPAPPPPPLAPKAVRPHTRPRTPTKVLHQVIVAPTVIPEEKPPEKEPDQAPPETEGEEAGDIGGVPGGIPDGVVDAADVPPPPPKRIRLDDSAVRLQRIAGPPIEYTPEAIDHEVEGTMIVRCIVNTAGAVHGCQVLKGLPFMDREVIGTLQRWRYAPYRLDGEPVEVEYTFKIRLELSQ